MLIQEGLSQLKMLRKRIADTNLQLSQYSAWNNKRNHPLGKVGVDDYSKKVAEEAVRSLFQKSKDLIDRFLRLKHAIELTNMQTEIEVAGWTMTISEALIIKREVVHQYEAVLDSIDTSLRAAISNVEYYNRDVEISKDAKADVWYLIQQKDIEEIRKFTQEFLEEVDAKLQIANATTHLIGIEE